MASEVSTRGAMVARWFGVDAGDDPYPESQGVDATQTLDLRQGQIILITGPSGAGKSALLRVLRLHHRESRWLDLSRVRLPERPVVDCMTDRLPSTRFADEDSRIVAALELLSRVGLGEVWTYLRRPKELSEGQRWRLRVALGLATATHARRRSTILVADEFCALLDRVTAMIVARALRRAVDAASESGKPICAVVATSHDDLAGALRPDIHANCDFGRVTLR
jgi:ABC-type ATPase with predicted acetyltransferase domain